MSRLDQFQHRAKVRHQDGREGVVERLEGFTVLAHLERGTAGKPEAFPVASLEVIEEAPTQRESV